MPCLSAEQSHTGRVVCVARQLPDPLVAAELVQESQAARQQTETGAELRRDDGVSLEENVVDVKLIEHVGQRQA